jgi:sialate O-acetylesterase
MSRDLDLMNLGGFLADRLPLTALIDAISHARDEGGWLIFVIHGIGADTHDSFVEPQVHHKLLDVLASESSIWVAPVIDVATWVRREIQAGAGIDKTR